MTICVQAWSKKKSRILCNKWTLSRDLLPRYTVPFYGRILACFGCVDSKNSWTNFVCLLCFPNAWKTTQLVLSLFFFSYASFKYHHDVLTSSEKESKEKWEFVITHQAHITISQPQQDSEGSDLPQNVRRSGNYAKQPQSQY